MPALLSAVLAHKPQVAAHGRWLVAALPDGRLAYFRVMRELSAPGPVCWQVVRDGADPDPDPPPADYCDVATALARLQAAGYLPDPLLFLLRIHRADLRAEIRKVDGREETITYYSPSDAQGRCHFALEWWDDMPVGTPPVYQRIRCGQHFFADPREYAFPRPEDAPDIRSHSSPIRGKSRKRSY